MTLFSLRLSNMAASHNSLEARQQPDHPFSTGRDIKSSRVTLCACCKCFSSLFIVLSAAERHWDNQSEDSNSTACVEPADHRGDLDTRVVVSDGVSIEKPTIYCSKATAACT